MKLRQLTILMQPPEEESFVKEHLHIILTENFNNEIILVNITKKLNRSFDDACLLYPGDHPFIQHESFVFYKKAIIYESNKIIEGLKSGNISNRNILDRGVFKRVCEGLEKSDHTDPRIRTFYESYLDSISG